MNYKFKITNLKKIDKELKKIFKKCEVCNELKIITNYYNKKTCKDGHINSCKECNYKKRKEMYQHKCLQCGKTFKSAKKIQKFCNTSCEGKFNRGSNNPNWKNKTHKGNCKYCGKNILIKEYTDKSYSYCSQECKSKHQKQILKSSNNPNWKGGMIKTKCDNCNTEIEITQYNFKIKGNHFCCNRCYAEWQSKNKCGENNPNWNPTKTIEEREKDRLIPGIIDFRKEVYKRDKYTCQCCGDNKGGNLNAHHLNSYNWDKEHRTDINNGITLCKKCHKEFHDIYGYGNNNYKQMLEFIENKNKIQIN